MKTIFLTAIVLSGLVKTDTDYRVDVKDISTGDTLTVVTYNAIEVSKGDTIDINYNGLRKH